jgi:amino acid transporter
MAEICSAYPTSGGLYYWSAKLSGEDWASLASWVTGWYALFRFFLISVVSSSSILALSDHTD